MVRWDERANQSCSQPTGALQLSYKQQLCLPTWTPPCDRQQNHFGDYILFQHSTHNGGSSGGHEFFNYFFSLLQIDPSSRHPKRAFAYLKKIGTILVWVKRSQTEVAQGFENSSKNFGCKFFQRHRSINFFFSARVLILNFIFFQIEFLQQNQRPANF